MFENAVANVCSVSREGQEDIGWIVWENQEASTSAPGPSSKKDFINQADKYKVVKFYVKDLQLSEPVDDNFMFKNAMFSYVCFSGTVVALNDYETKLSLQVNDGTGTIICLLDASFLKKVEENRAKYSKELNPLTQNTDSNEFLRATLINYKSIKYMLESIPSSSNSLVGQFVSILGKLKLHHKTKYVFVSTIKKISVAEYLEDLDNLFNMYSKYDLK